MDTNKCLIIIIIVVLIFILIQRILSTKKIIDKFDSSGDLTTSETQTNINNIIDTILKERMKTIRLIASSSDNAMDLLDEESPLGMIAFFYENPNSDTNNTYWVECNGGNMEKQDYPEFFEYFNIQNQAINKPNLIGRTIVGAGTVNVKDNKNTDSVYNSNGQAFNTVESGNIMFKPLEKGGSDWCPSDDLFAVKTEPDYGIKMCSVPNNMPPHINLIPYMKVKNRKYKITYDN